MAKDWQMSQGEWAIFKNDKKIFNDLEKSRYYCRCGHSITITSKQEKAFCSWCKRWVYKDKAKQEEYDEKIKIDKEKIKRIKFKKELLKRL